VLRSPSQPIVATLQIQKCEAYSVDGILISVTSHTRNLNHLIDAVDTDLPIVQFDRVISNTDVRSVTINDHTAAEQATQILIDQGLTNIYGFFGPESLQISENRSAGFESALQKQGISIKGKVKFANHKEDIAEILRSSVLDNPKYPIGIFCNSDETLVEVYKVLNESNISIPEQVSLSCISDGVTPKMLKIEVPYIEHSGYDVGWEASQLLLSLLKSDDTSHIKDVQVATRAMVHP